MTAPTVSEVWTRRSFTLAANNAAHRGGAASLSLISFPGKVLPRAVAGAPLRYHGGVALLSLAVSPTEVNRPMLFIGTFAEDKTESTLDQTVDVDLGDAVEIYWYANDGSLTAEDVGGVCYITDDDGIVAKLTMDSVLAGRVWAVDTINGVAVQKPTVGAGAPSIIGPRGPAGAVGATGDPGPQGDPGVAGAGGSAGATGAKGDTGAAGAAGAAGAKGDTGVAGDAGAPGAKGDTGAAGAPGATGAKGDTGAAGADGAPGATGATGAGGSAGATGAKGDTGAAGAKGDTGAAGAAGAAGATGATGATGAAGAPGAVSIDAPFLVPGYVWVRGDTLVGADGTALTTWANDAQVTHPGTKTGTVTMQTVGGFRVARFNNGRFDFSSYDFPVNELSIFAVFSPNTLGGGQFLLGGGGGQSRIQFYLQGVSTWGVYMASGAGGLYPTLNTTFVVGTKYLVEVHITAPTDVSLVLNGAATRVQIAGSVYPGWTLSNIRLGQDPGGNQPCYLDLFEFFVCPVSAVATMRTFLREYFRSKYSIY
jgi:hypothetical protein